MKVIETRATSYGLKRRRYDGGPGGTPLTTYEVPSEVLSRLGWKRIEARMKVWHQHRCTQAKYAALRKSILDHPDTPAPSLAKMLGCPREYVNKVRHQARKKQ